MLKKIIYHYVIVISQSSLFYHLQVTLKNLNVLSLRVWSLCSTTREAATVRGPCTAMKSGPRLPQLEKALAQKQRPNIAISN